jgi:hypothetical protein
MSHWFLRLGRVLAPEQKNTLPKRDTGPSQRDCGNHSCRSEKRLSVVIIVVQPHVREKQCFTYS